MLWKSHLLLQLIRGPIKGQLDLTSLPVPSLPNFTHRLLKGVRIASDGTAKTRMRFRRVSGSQGQNVAWKPTKKLFFLLQHQQVKGASSLLSRSASLLHGITAAWCRRHGNENIGTNVRTLKPLMIHWDALFPPTKPISFLSHILIPLTNVELMAALEGTGSVDFQFIGLWNMEWCFWSSHTWLKPRETRSSAWKVSKYLKSVA